MSYKKLLIKRYLNNTGGSLEQSLLENGIQSSASKPIGNKESHQEILPIFFNKYYFSNMFSPLPCGK
jgi:hypothetical protein